MKKEWEVVLFLTSQIWPTCQALLLAMLLLHIALFPLELTFGAPYGPLIELLWVCFSEHQYHSHVSRIFLATLSVLRWIYFCWCDAKCHIKYGSWKAETSSHCDLGFIQSGEHLANEWLWQVSSSHSSLRHLATENSPMALSTLHSPPPPMLKA